MAPVRRRTPDLWWPCREHLQVVLLIVGALAEFAGIVLIGFPDFVPGALRLSNWLRPRVQRLRTGVRRLLRRPQPGVSHQRFATDSATVSDHAPVEQYGDPGATLEQQVEFLLMQDVKAQRQLNALRRRIDSLEKDMPRRLTALRGDMETHVAETQAAALAEYRPLRIAGTVALASD